MLCSEGFRFQIMHYSINKIYNINNIYRDYIKKKRVKPCGDAANFTLQKHGHIFQGSQAREADCKCQ